MAEIAAAYGFGEHEFERAIAVLDQIEHSIRLPWWQRLLYRLYGILVSALVVSCIACVVIVSAFQFATSDAPGIIFILLAIVAIIAFVGCLVFIPLNLPLLAKVHRQKRRLRALGIADTAIGFVAARPAQRGWRLFLRKSFLVAGLLGFITAIVVSSMTRQPVYLLLIGSLGLVFILFYALQEGKLWLDILASRMNEITELKQKLAGLNKPEAGRIDVPTELVAKLAQIQKDQIQIGRANAIAEFKSSGEMFAVLSSSQVLRQKAHLDPGTRLKVEDAIEDLMQTPKPPAAQTGGEAGSVSFAVPGTDLNFVYLVDEKEDSLRLIELRGPAIGQASPAASGGIRA